MAAKRKNNGYRTGDDYDWRKSPDLQDELDDEDSVDLRASQEIDGLMKDPNAPKGNPFVLPELGQVPPPDYPLKWCDKPETERPESPQVEYVRSPYPLDLPVIARRWEGLHTYEQIELEYQMNNWRLQRFEYQDKVARGAIESSLAADVNFKRRVVNESIVIFHSMRERLSSDFDNAFEYEKATNAGPLGYVKRPMGIRSRTALAKATIEVDNALMTRVGVATQIYESNVNVKVGPQKAIADYLKENDPEYAALLALAGAGGQNFASTPPQIEEGGSIHDWRGEFDKTPVNEPVGGRLFDAPASVK